MVATGINKETRCFDVASGPFKCHCGALWPHDALMKSFNTQKRKQTKKTERVDKAY